MVNPNETGVATNDPSQAEGTNESTLENLEQNIANQLNSLADESGSAEEATETPSEPPAAADVKVEETQAEAAATAERVKQDNANLRATLIKIGIDPDSATAEQLRSGLVTFDDVIRSRQPAPTAPVTTTTTAPKLPLDQKLVNLQSALNKQKEMTYVPVEDYVKTQGEMLEVITDLVQANQSIYKTQENTALQNLLDKTLSATKEIFHNNVKASVPDDVRQIGEDLFIGATDLAVGKLAREIGQEKAFTPDGYRHVATKLAPDFDKFVQAIYKAGGQAAIEAINKGQPAGQTVVNPLQPGVSGGSPSPPAKKGQFSMENLEGNVNAFLANTQSQV